MTNQFIASFTFNQAPDEAFLAAVPKEHEHIVAYLNDGTIQSIYLAEDRTQGWLIIPATTQAEAEQVIQTLPLYPYMIVTPLAQYP